MDAAKQEIETGVIPLRLWTTKAMYALDSFNLYFEILTYRTGDSKESSMGQVTALAGRPSGSYSNYFICTGTKAVMPIDNTRCGYDHADGRIVFLRDIVRAKLSRVREDPESKKKHRFFLLQTVDLPVDPTDERSDEMISKHVINFGTLKNTARRGGERLPMVGTDQRNTMPEHRAGPSTLEVATPVLSDPKPLSSPKTPKNSPHLDPAAHDKNLYKAFLSKCAIPMKMETVSITQENTKNDEYFGTAEDLTLFKLFITYMKEHEDLVLDIETISSLEFTKTAVCQSILVLTISKDRIRGAHRLTRS